MPRAVVITRLDSWWLGSFADDLALVNRGGMAMQGGPAVDPDATVEGIGIAVDGGPADTAGLDARELQGGSAVSLDDD